MLVVNFLEAMHVHDDQAEWQAIAFGTIQFAIKDSIENPAIVKSSQRDR